MIQVSDRSISEYTVKYSFLSRERDGKKLVNKDRPKIDVE